MIFPSFQVIRWQERATQELCSCSEPHLARAQTLKPTLSNPSINREHPHHNITHGRRRSSSDIAKLSPIETCVSADGKPCPSNAGTKGRGAVRNSGYGDDPVCSGNQGSARRATRIEDEKNDGRKGSTGSGRQLDSIVDEARAEVCTLLHAIYADTVHVFGLPCVRRESCRLAL